jgi:hypothetical protein
MGACTPEDHLALQQLATEYANAVDSKQWDRLDKVFGLDSIVDYTATGGIAARYPEIKQWLPKNLKFFQSYMHLMGNFAFEVDGDTATGQVSCYNPMVVRRLLGGSRHTVIFGIWYHDTYIRTADGWRIATRRQESCYSAHVPLWMKLGTAAVAWQGRRKAGPVAPLAPT